MKKILIATGDQTYAASTASATTNTGVTANILANGALAFYGLVENDATTAANSNQWCLITDGASSAGIVDVDDFVTGGGNAFQLVQGATTFPTRIDSIQRRNIRRITKQAYVAPTKQVSFIGFNGVNGSLNLPTITQNSEAEMLAVEQEAATVDKIRNQEDYGSGPLTVSANGYDILAPITVNINTQPSNAKSHTAYITSNGTLTATVTATGVLTLTKDSATLSFATAVPAGWVTGDLIAIANDVVGAAAPAAAATNINSTVYKVLSVVGKTLILDRPYRGASGTVSQANVQAGYLAKLSAVTEYGLKLVVDTAGKIYNYAIQGVIQNATVTYAGGTNTPATALTQSGSTGLGTGAAISAIEEGLIAYRGQFDTVDRRMKQLPRYAVPTGTYNVYTIQYANSTVETGANQNKSDNSTIAIAVPTTWTAVTTFEAVLKKLATNALVNF